MMKTKTLYPVIIFLMLATCLFSCSDYGKKTSKGHIDVYYKDGISEDDAQRTADFLYMIDAEINKNTSTEKSIQLVKANDTILFRMVVQKDRMASIGEESFMILANVVSDSVFNGQPVNMDLTDNRFKTIKSLHYKKVMMEEPEAAPAEPIQ
jgi:hypothetical protein